MENIWEHVAFFAATLNVWISQPDVRTEQSMVTPSTVYYSYDRTAPENSMRWATDMRDVDSGMQAAFWGHVEAKAKELTPVAEKMVQSRVAKLRSEKNKMLLEDISALQNEIETILSSLVLTEHLQAVKGKLSPPQFLFVFDEARALLTGTTLVSKFEVMRRALRTFAGGMFTLYLDTTGKTANFVPPSFADVSARVYRETHKLVPPIYFIPTVGVVKLPETLDSARWLRVPPEGTELGALRYDFLGLVEHARPLFPSYFLTRMSSFDTTDLAHFQSVVDFAIFKLCAGSRTIKFADIIACICLRYGLTHTDAHKSDNLVASHMAVCVQVSQDRSFVHSR